MYLGLGQTSTRRSNRSGRSMAASTPIMALTEWPTNTAGGQVERVQDLGHVRRVALQAAVPGRRVRREVRAAGTDVVEEHHPVVAVNAGATWRHIPWSHPNPWAKTIGRPSGRPDR